MLLAVVLGQYFAMARLLTKLQELQAADQELKQADQQLKLSDEKLKAATRSAEEAIRACLAATSNESGGSGWR